MDTSITKSINPTAFLKINQEKLNKFKRAIFKTNNYSQEKILKISSEFVESLLKDIKTVYSDTHNIKFEQNLHKTVLLFSIYDYRKLHIGDLWIDTKQKNNAMLIANTISYSNRMN